MAAQFRQHFTTTTYVHIVTENYINNEGELNDKISIEPELERWKHASERDWNINSKRRKHNFIVKFHVDQNVFKSLAHMIAADILVIGNSGKYCSTYILPNYFMCL
jgi:hypothetical protein